MTEKVFEDSRLWGEDCCKRELTLLARAGQIDELVSTSSETGDKVL